MALNHFTDEEAIERVVTLRDTLPVKVEGDLQARYADKDALAQVINLACIGARVKLTSEVVRGLFKGADE